MKKISVAVTVMILLTAVAAYGQTSKKAQLIKFTKELETAPFAENAEENRGWALRWAMETDQVSVVICWNRITRVFREKKNKFGSELLAQYTIGMAAFKLENPDKASDEDVAQLAGIESSLRAYTAMIAEKPKGKFQGMDDLVAMRDRGELTRDKFSGCKGSDHSK